MERPYLRIQTPEVRDRGRGFGGGAAVSKPSPARQRDRLGESFDRLSELLNEGRIGELVQDPSSLAPERALVFEVVGGRIATFAQLAERIGLEFLLEEEDEIESSDDFKVVERKNGQDVVRDEKPVPVHFYLGMPDETALRQLVGLWRAYQDGTQFPYGQTAWRDLFERLHTIRPWSGVDRVQSADRDFFLAQVQAAPDEPVRCELELWYSDSDETQLRRSQHIVDILNRVGGEVVAETRFPFIRYHALLCELPGRVIAELAALDEHVELLRADDVMFIRPQSVASVEQLEDVDTSDAALGDSEISDLPPLVAILDGYPVESHDLIANRLEIDDPEDLASRYASPNLRVHGTSMASLVCRGDANRPSRPVGRRVHLRPVLCCPTGSHEQFRPDQLLLDTIYRAVTRLFEGEGGSPATAPTVKVINLSLGDLSRPFARRMTPWARLLDYLAWRYKVLFIVSAGNISGHLEVPGFQNMTQFEDANPEDREIGILAGINAERARRTILSPAESVNALTVGAQHEDALGGVQLPAGVVNPLVSSHLPIIVSRLGLGYRGAIKPEFLSPGGRTLMRMQASGTGLRLGQINNPSRFAGIGAAIPDSTGRLNQTANFSDTSTATALTTRQAHLIMEAMLEADLIEEDDPALSLYAKALLVHHAKVNPRTYEKVEVIVNNGQSVSAKKRDIAKLLGFGGHEYDFELGCLASRAVLIGHHVISANQCHRYQVPAPAELSGVRGWRGITLTVAWFSPINPNHQMYRSAKLDVKLGGCLGADGNNVMQVDNHSRGKGTVYHTRIEGRDMAVIRDNASFHFDIECLEQTGHLDEQIPYALAISVEVGDEIGIDVYQRIRERLQVQIRG